MVEILWSGVLTKKLCLKHVPCKFLKTHVPAEVVTI